MEEKVLTWAANRGILTEANTSSQFMKLMEEIGELAQALLNGNKEEQIDAIGDVQVVLIILSHMLKLDSRECLKSAYNVIKLRKGKMINGTFVKEK